MCIDTIHIAYLKGVIKTTDAYKGKIIQFIADHDRCPDSDFNKGYHLALEHLSAEFLEDI